MSQLVVSEIFGPTFQGEGPSTGRRAGFVRLGRCPLACTWCDTPYTWDWSRFDPATELREVDTHDVVAELAEMRVGLVVITGGEPLAQQRRLQGLVDQCAARGWEVEVETAGILAPALDKVTRWNVSPKLASSGNPVEQRYRPDVLRAFEGTGRAAFKFVATDVGDLDEIGEIVGDCGLGDVWVMPEATDPARLAAALSTLAPAVLERGWNLTTRLHVQIWGDRRGV